MEWMDNNLSDFVLAVLVGSLIVTVVGIQISKKDYIGILFGNIESLKNMTNKRKKLTFRFAMLSLLGLGWGFVLFVTNPLRNYFYLDNLLLMWFFFSLPLIIIIIYNIIFREE